MKKRVAASAIAAIAMWSWSAQAQPTRGLDVGVGLGRYYGGSSGVWLARSVHDLVGGTVAGGIFHNLIGWDVGIQVVTPKLDDTWVVRGNLQYGTYGTRRGPVGDPDGGRKAILGWGAGLGVGRRVDAMQWLVLDAWTSVSARPEFADNLTGTGVSLSFGLVVGRM